MVGRIIDDYLAGVDNGRVVVPGYGAYIKRGGGEKVFVDLLRTDDGVLCGLIVGRLHCDPKQAQAMIADYVAEQLTGKKQTEEPVDPDTKVEAVRQTIVKPEETSEPEKVVPEYKKRKRLDPIIILALIAIVCVIALVITAYIINGGESLGLS